MMISAKYYLRNFLPKILYQRTLGYCREKVRLLCYCRKEIRSLGYCRKEVRPFGLCRKQMRSLGPCSWGVTLSRGVPLVIIVLHCSLVDLPLLKMNRQALTSKSFLIQEDTFIRKGLLQGTFIRRIWSRFRLSTWKMRLSLSKPLSIYVIW